MRISFPVSPEGNAGPPVLLDPTVFDAFDVAPNGHDVAAVLDALGSSGGPCEEADHVFIAVDAVRALAGSHADEEWETQFSAMLAYAGSKGWLNDDDTMIKAHLSDRPTEDDDR